MFKHFYRLLLTLSLCSIGYSDLFAPDYTTLVKDNNDIIGTKISFTNMLNTYVGIFNGSVSTNLDLSGIALIQDIIAANILTSNAFITADIDLQGQISSNDVDIVSLQGQISSNDVDIVSLQGQISSNDVDIATIESRIDSGVDRVYSGLTPPTQRIGAIWIDTFDPDGTWPNPHLFKVQIKNGWETVMLDGVYDANANSIVDDSERLSGKLSNYYMPRESTYYFRAGPSEIKGSLQISGLTSGQNASFKTTSINGVLTTLKDIHGGGGNGTSIYAQYMLTMVDNVRCAVFGDVNTQFTTNRMTIVALQHGRISNCTASMVAGYDQKITRADSSIISGSRNQIMDTEDCLVNVKASDLEDIYYSLISGTNITASTITNCVIFGTDISITNREGEFYVENMNVLLHLPQATSAPAGLPSGAMWVDSDDDYSVKVKQ